MKGERFIVTHGGRLVLWVLDFSGVLGWNGERVGGEVRLYAVSFLFVCGARRSARRQRTLPPQGHAVDPR